MQHKGSRRRICYSLSQFCVSLFPQCWWTRFGDWTAINNFERDKGSTRRKNSVWSKCPNYFRLRLKLSTDEKLTGNSKPASKLTVHTVSWRLMLRSLSLIYSVAPTEGLGGELILVELISTSNQKEKKKTSKVLQCRLVDLADLAMIRNSQPPSQQYSVHHRADIYAMFMWNRAQLVNQK